MRLVAGWCALAACTFTPPGAGDSGVVTIVDDTEADFASHALLDGGVVTPWGTIEPEAFVIDGLHARAFATNLVADADTYDDVVAKATMFLGASYRQAPTDWGSSLRPKGLGLTSPDQYTVFYDGEIELPAGIQKLELDADDRAIVQVALDDVTFGERLFAHNAITSIQLDVRSTGWYPIRVAYAQAGGNARFLLTIIQGQNRTPVVASQLRARVTDQPGLIAFAFNDQTLVVPQGETAVPTIDQAFGALPPPYDLDVSFDRFTLRHIGQLRVDAQGTYTFRANVGPDVDDGYRVWIDGALVISYWTGNTLTPMGNVDLAPGWHDLVVDYSDSLGNAQVTLLMSGPGIADAAIDPAHLRPAVASGLVAAFVLLADTAIPDNAFTDQPLAFSGPELGVIDTVDYGFGIKNHQFTDLAVELDDCSGAKQVPISTTNVLVPSYFFFSGDASCAGTPLVPATPWRYRFTDSTVGNGGLFGPAYWNPLLVASYHGGPRVPFAKSVTYVSAPKPTPGATALGAIRVTAADHGAHVEISVRSAADEDTLAVTPWEVVENGAAPHMAAGALVQYQLAIAGDGWQYPAIDRVELDYTAN